MKQKKYKAIQKDIIKKYKININNENRYKNKDRPTKLHTNIKNRTLYQWKYRGSARATLNLLHEVGRIETYKPNSPKSENEFCAAQWTIDRAKEYDIIVSDSMKQFYQSHVDEALKEDKIKGVNCISSYQLKS